MSVRDLIKRLGGLMPKGKGTARQVICSNCGEEFTGYQARSRCCSQKCRDEYEKKLRLADPLRGLKANSRRLARRSTRWRSSKYKRAIIADAMAAFESDSRYVLAMMAALREHENRVAGAIKAAATRAEAKRDA